MNTKERGQIRLEGMGGFLNPPTHPEHKASVEFDLRRRRENRGGMSLSAAVECDWLDDAIRAEAKRKLAEWDKPPIEDERIQDWIRQVLGYFKNCWKGDGSEPECWHVSNLRMGGVHFDLLDHAGVHFILKYYPDYVPECEHFSEAYWGVKRDADSCPCHSPVVIENV